MCRRRGGSARLAARLAAAGLLALAGGYAAPLTAAPSVAAAPVGAGSAGVPDADPTGQVPTEQDILVGVGPEPTGTSVLLDATVYAPGDGRAHPALVIAHGFGGSKADLVDRARDYARHGYVVLAYSARGFGASGGRVHLDDPAFEVADARALVDVLAGRPDVRADAPGDPRVGVLGASYGGALAVMLGATDPRVDTVVSAITWNDLAEAFFPQFSTTGPDPATPAEVLRTPLPGPFKALWATRFLGSVASGGGASATASGANPLCGRFDPTVCRLFLTTAQTGAPSEELLALLHAHSPRPLLAGLHAPTYLVQGMADSLFGLEQADATARALTAQGTPVALRWVDGGHDGTSSTLDADDASVRIWLDHYLAPDAIASTVASPSAAASPNAVAPPIPPTGIPVPAFVYASPIPRRQSVAPLTAVDRYVDTASWTTLPMGVTDAQTVATPPGGQPASQDTAPGVSLAGAGAAAYQLAALPGASAAFDSLPLLDRTTVVGAPRVQLTVRSTDTTVTLFVSLWQVTGGIPSQPRRLVAPVTVATTPGRLTTIDVALPPATWAFEVGTVLRVLVTSTDSMYAGPRAARIDRVNLLDATLHLPSVTGGTALPGPTDRDGESMGVAAAIVGALALLGGSAWWQRRRRRHEPHRRDLAAVPLVVDGLVKTYSDGHRAVDDVSWRAEPGQVVGLLGPNGAGKTTTLRMVMGLIAPDAGTAYVLGEPVHPVSPVLARVGALVEGPGFLPHLSGLENLRAFWAATGRPEADAHYADALAVAALGGAIERPVRSYSHGMRQRLGIAQAMLGLPELLVLDEPTNGLDPPQIAAMRPILHRYAATGRTVVISSHLLAEVEVTCSHVVVMNAGQVVMTGRVADLVASADTTVIGLAAGADAASVAARLRGRPGVVAVEVTEDPAGPRLTIHSGMPRADVVRSVTATGADIVEVTSRRHLEEVFLGVIAAAQEASAGAGPMASQPSSLTDRLRQVRAR
jgi:ABC-2 type transport system ATP-binding protein